MAASIPKVPLAIPGTILSRGIRAREYMCEYFRKQLPRNRSHEGTDMLSLLCNATDEDGNRYTDQEVIDHMNFLMMAAHDTTTSTLTSMTCVLARYPEWQQRLLAEVDGLGVEHLRYEDLDRMAETDWVMKEALRIYPPLSMLPKYSVAPVEFEGLQMPADAIVITYPIHTHYMEEYWTQPNKFDPERYHRTLRYDWLADYLFDSIEEVQAFATNWLWTYNHERPNMALGGFTPKQKLAMAA